MGARAWSIRAYRPGDEDGIRALFRRVFGHGQTSERWKWRFERNPYAPVAASLACRDGDGAIVGQYSVMHVALNVMGQRVAACQSLDTMVHPEFQGQGMFTALARDCYAALSESGVAAVFGIPNRSSYPGFLQHLGWRRIGFLEEYSFRLGIRDRIERLGLLGWVAHPLDVAYRALVRLRLGMHRRLLERRIGRELRFGRSRTVPGEYDALWKAISSREVLSVWKDGAYLGWRYDQDPDHRSDYFFLSEHDRMVALCVVRAEASGRVPICELLVRDHDVLAARLLLARILLHHAEAGSAGLQFFGRDAGFFDEAFSDFRSVHAFSLPFCGRVLEHALLQDLFTIPDNWTICAGDTDLV
jgi:predicted N-acetyltransferase YhbS